MSENSDNLSKILSQFSTEETLLQEKLQAIQFTRSELERRNPTRFSLNFESSEDVFKTKQNALKRNAALRMEINITMSKLRSKRCYNPVEDNLNKMIDKYSEILSRDSVN